MGNQSNKISPPIQLSSTHPKFNNAKFIVNGNKRYMQTIMSVQNKQYQRWKQKIENQKYNTQFLLLPTNHQFSSKGLCGNNGTLILHFQDFPYLLIQQIIDRKGKKKLFQQHQLWYLLFALISAKKDMSPPYSKIGDIRPHNIFINQQKQIKIVNILTFPHQSTNFTKALQNQSTYLAPQQLKQLQLNIPQSTTNQSQLFSIGLTLLSAIVQQDFLDIYDLKKYFIDTQKLTQKINQFKINRAYSDIFKGLVCNLCEFQTQKRITPQELWDWIAPHQKDIRMRKNFYIPSAPPKIRQQVTEVRQSISQLYPNNDGKIAYTSPTLNFPPSIIRTTTLPDPKHMPSYTNPPSDDFQIQHNTYTPQTASNQQRSIYPPPSIQPSISSLAQPLLSGSITSNQNKKILQPSYSSSSYQNQNQNNSFLLHDQQKKD